MNLRYFEKNGEIRSISKIIIRKDMTLDAAIIISSAQKKQKFSEKLY